MLPNMNQALLRTRIWLGDPKDIENFLAQISSKLELCVRHVSCTVWIEIRAAIN